MANDGLYYFLLEARLQNNTQLLQKALEENKDVFQKFLSPYAIHHIVFLKDMSVLKLVIESGYPRLSTPTSTEIGRAHV